MQQISLLRSQPFEQMRIVYLICCITFTLPFVFGYGILPLTNFSAEAISATGVGLMLMVLAHGTYRAAPSFNFILLSGAISIIVAMLVAQYCIFGRQNIDAYLAVLGYLFLAVLAIWCGHDIGKSPYSKLWTNAVAACIATGATVAATGSILQYFQVDGQIVFLSPASEAGRTFGFLRQPNHQATFLNMGLLAFFFFYEQKKISQWLWAVLSFAAIFAIVTTGSRTGLLQIGFFTVFTIFYRYRSSDKLKVSAPLFILAITALAWTALYFLHQTGESSFYGLTKVQQTASEGLGVRRIVWLQTWQMILECPWYGCGALRYPATYYLGGWSIESGMSFSHSHNFFMQVIFDYGWSVATLLFIAIIYVIYSVCIKLLNSASFFYIAVVFCVAIHSIFEFPLWYAYFMVPCCFSLGFLAAGSREGDTRQNKNSGSAPVNQSRNSKNYWVFAKIFAGAGVILTAVTMTSDYYKITPLYVPGLQKTLDERIHEAEKSFWFRRFAEFPRIQVEVAKDIDFYKKSTQISEIGCLMAEPWFQTGTIVNSVKRNREAEAKWLIYIFSTMTNGNTKMIEGALTDLNTDRAREMVAYARNVVPVKADTTTFSEKCKSYIPVEPRFR